MDMWSDLRQRHYILLTFHLFEVDILISGVLSEYEFADGVKSGQNIRKSIENACCLLSISNQTLARHLLFCNGPRS